MRHSTIDFEALRYLLAVADGGRFVRAAEFLEIEPGSLGKRIQRIEEELGLTVFERNHDGIRLTSAGEEVIVHVKRALAEFSDLFAAGRRAALGNLGRIRLGVRLPLVGEPLQGLLRVWRQRYPGVYLVIHELNEREIIKGMEDRHLDVALMTKHTLWPRAVAEPVYRERLLAALPTGHPLAKRRRLTWQTLREETLLVQGWEESHTAQEYYAGFLGSGARYGSHAASKQSVLGLVGAGFGVTLVTEAQAQVRIPGVVFRRIDEENAELEIELVWVPENKDPVVGRFVKFMQEMSASRRLL